MDAEPLDYGLRGVLYQTRGRARIQEALRRCLAADLVHSIGEETTLKDARRDAIALNAGMGLYVAGVVTVWARASTRRRRARRARV